MRSLFSSSKDYHVVSAIFPIFKISANPTRFVTKKHRITNSVNGDVWRRDKKRQSRADSALIMTMI
jgi:hypothetical protein